MSNENDAPPKKSSGILGTVIAIGIIVLTSAILGLLLFKFVLQPQLTTETTTEAKADVDEVDAFPEEAVTVDLPEEQVTVNSASEDGEKYLLMYQVTLVAANPATAEIINARMSHFQATVLQIHRNRTYTELSDSYVQETMVRQVVQDVNALLRRFTSDESVRVIEAMHKKYTLYPL